MPESKKNTESMVTPPGMLSDCFCVRHTASDSGAGFPNLKSAPHCAPQIEFRLVYNSITLCLIWLPIVDAYRTICIAPSPEVRAVFEAVRELSGVAC